MKLSSFIQTLHDQGIPINHSSATYFFDSNTIEKPLSKTKVELFDELKSYGLSEDSKLFNKIWNDSQNLPLK